MSDARGAPAHAGFDPELRIDWVRAAELGDGLPGDLGLTILPGKQGASVRYPGHVYRRDLDGDLATLRQAGVVRLVLLVVDAELARWGDREIVARGRATGVEVRRHPISDGKPPASMKVLEAILADIDEGRRRGSVAVACMGGVGRTGTVVACSLVRAGRDPEAAIARIRAVRHRTAVETREQEEFVRSYAQQLGGDREA
jgi:protein-tyrosine phosphatase